MLFRIYLLKKYYSEHWQQLSLSQIFCKHHSHFQVIVEGKIEPDAIESYGVYVKVAVRRSHTFHGEISFKTLPTTFPQIFCKIILSSQVIAKGTIDPEELLRYMN